MDEDVEGRVVVLEETNGDVDSPELVVVAVYCVLDDGALRVWAVDDPVFEEDWSTVVDANMERDVVWLVPCDEVCLLSSCDADDPVFEVVRELGPFDTAEDDVASVRA